MGLGVHPQNLAVGGHHRRRQQAVDGQAVPADQVADPAIQRQPADPHRGRVAQPGGQAVGAGGQPGLDPGGALFGIDVERFHVGEVEHDAAVGEAVAGEAVAAAAGRQLQPASRASVTTWATSPGAAGRTITAGRRWSKPP
jgi:hypothetical protein